MLTFLNLAGRGCAAKTIRRAGTRYVLQSMASGHRRERELI